MNMAVDSGGILPGLLVIGFLNLLVVIITADRRILTAFSLLSLVYSLYYVLFVVARPSVCCHANVNAFLQRHCPAMFSYFFPTIWTVEGQARTIVRTIFQRSPSVKLKRYMHFRWTDDVFGGVFSREELVGWDGGILCIDWVGRNNHEATHGRGKNIVVVIPGITGGSKETYALHIAAAVLEKGVSCVIMTQRGNHDSPLTTPRTYCATCFADVQTLHTHIIKNHPTASLFFVGISLGALQMTHYLGHLGAEAAEKRIVGAMVVSMPYDTFESKKTIEMPINHLTAGFYLLYKSKSLFERHRKIFDANKDKLPFDLDHGLQARSLNEIDRRIICPMYGYSSWEEYYREACPGQSMAKIKVLYLAMNAEDDPFSPGHAIAEKDFAMNPNLILLKTKVGGHIGFTEDFIPTGPTLVEKVLTQFCLACFSKESPF
eukprot:m.21910 g.21910  ORF g.21910 m.21910 type:complete len:432 (+) comp28243_c0_seq4:24-1319(+)